MKATSSPSSYHASPFPAWVSGFSFWSHISNVTFLTSHSDVTSIISESIVRVFLAIMKNIYILDILSLSGKFNRAVSPGVMTSSSRNSFFNLDLGGKVWCFSLGMTVRFPFIGVVGRQKNEGGWFLRSEIVFFINEVKNINLPQYSWRQIFTPYTVVHSHFQPNFRCT